MLANDGGIADFVAISMAAEDESPNAQTEPAPRYRRRRPPRDSPPLATMRQIPDK